MPQSLPAPMSTHLAYELAGGAMFDQLLLRSARALSCFICLPANGADVMACGSSCVAWTKSWDWCWRRS